METSVISKYGPHSEATAPNAMPVLQGRGFVIDRTSCARPEAMMAQREAINARAASESADYSVWRVGAYYGKTVPPESIRCRACGYPAWDLVAGVCGACRRRP
jgi:hypothetical protein